MNQKPYCNRPIPVWIRIIIIFCILPVLSFPSLIAMTQSDTASRTLVWLYPFYVIASGICAWICYGQRREMTWILIVLMLLSHVAVHILVYQQ